MADMKSIMADTFSNPSKSVSCKTLLQFMDAVVLRKAAQTPMLTGKHSEPFLNKGGAP